MAVRETLLKDVSSESFLVVTLPSFRPEWMAWVEAQPQPRACSRTAESPIWNGPVSEPRVPAEPPTLRCAPLAGKVARAIGAGWVAMLRGTHYSAPPPDGEFWLTRDGVTYHFSGISAGQGRLAGRTWCPGSQHGYGPPRRAGRGASEPTRARRRREASERSATSPASFPSASSRSKRALQVSVSLEGPVELIDGKLMLRIPLAAGGDALAPLATAALERSSARTSAWSSSHGSQRSCALALAASSAWTTATGSSPSRGAPRTTDGRLTRPAV